MNRNFWISLIAAAALIACDGGGMMMMTDQPDTTCDTGAATVTMAQLQTQIIETKCKSCHYPAMGGMAEGSGYAYGDYTSTDKTYEMVGKLSLYKGSAGTLKIVDNDTSKSTAARLANSSLWLKVSPKSPKTSGFKGPNGESTNATMPQGGPFLSDAEVKLFKDFICTGATKM